MIIKRTIPLALLACSLVAGGQFLGSGAAQATPGTCSTWSSGATGYGKCSGTPSNGWTQFRVVLTCYDGISSTFVGGGTSAWTSYGHTASASCGAPQRQTVSTVGIETR